MQMFDDLLHTYQIDVVWCVARTSTRTASKMGTLHPVNKIQDIWQGAEEKEEEKKWKVYALHSFEQPVLIFRLSSDRYRYRQICICIACQKKFLKNIPLQNLWIMLRLPFVVCFFLLLSSLTPKYAVILYRIVCITHECPCIICRRFFFLFVELPTTRPCLLAWCDGFAFASSIQFFIVLHVTHSIM